MCACDEVCKTKSGPLLKQFFLKSHGPDCLKKTLPISTDHLKGIGYEARWAYTFIIHLVPFRFATFRVVSFRLASSRLVSSRLGFSFRFVCFFLARFNSIGSVCVGGFFGSIRLGSIRFFVLWVRFVSFVLFLFIVSFASCRGGGGNSSRYYSNSGCIVFSHVHLKAMQKPCVRHVIYFSQARGSILKVFSCSTRDIHPYGPAAKLVKPNLDPY